MLDINKNKTEIETLQVGHDYAEGNIYHIYNQGNKFINITPVVDAKPVWYFTGRETELEHLRKSIDQGGKSLLVSGMGGIGKTQICKALYQEYLQKAGKGIFTHIGYFIYDTDIGTTLVKGLGIETFSDFQENKAAAWSQLVEITKTGKLLLFLDNMNQSVAEDPELIKLCSLQGAIVVSSRREAVHDSFKPYRIGFLSTEECSSIYENVRYDRNKDISGESKKVKIPEEERQALIYIIEELVVRHTITIEHLAYLAKSKHWSVFVLKEQLKEKGFRLQFRKDGKLINIQESYEILYDLSELSAAEQNILEAFSVFPYIPLSFEVANQWLLEDAGVNDDTEILDELCHKGWLQYFEEQESYAMHPVFAAFVYDKCRPSMKKHSRLVEACQDSMQIPDDGSLRKCQTFLTFAIEIIKKLAMDADVKEAVFLSNTAYLLYKSVQYKESKILYQKSLKIREEVLGENHPDTAASYNNLAGVYEEEGEYEKAEELYQKSLKIREEVLGENHPDTAASYNNLGGVYQAEGDYEKAEELYQKSLKISEELLGENHPDTAASYNNLGGVYQAEGDYEKAEELYQKSLKIREEVLGENHPDTAASYNNLAGVYQAEGDYEKAEELYQKSLKISEELLGENHPSTAASYNNLAGVYQAEGDYEKAEELYQKSLKIREEVLGENHPDTATSYNNLAGVYIEEGEYEKAEELYQKSLKIREELLGENHPSTAASYNNLAGVYKAEGDYEKAEELYIKALIIFLTKLGKDYPGTQIVYCNLKDLFERIYSDRNYDKFLKDEFKKIL